MSKIKILYFVVLLLLSISAFYILLLKENGNETKFIQRDSESEFFILYTSYTKDESKLVNYNNEKIINSISISDIALENVKEINNSFYFTSRISGNYYNLKDHELTKNELQLKKGITNLVNTDTELAIITNTGLKNINEKEYYESGIYISKTNHEYSFTEGFITSGVFFNDFYYLLSYNPTVKKEVVLKINSSGKILKTFELGTKPQHGHNSMISTSYNIYLVSDFGVITIFDKEDNVSKIDSENTQQVLSLHKNFEDEILILTDYGEILTITGNKVSQRISIERNKSRIIYISSIVKDNNLYILYTYEGESVHGSKEGVLIKYNISTGKILESYEVENIDDLVLRGFGVY